MSRLLKKCYQLIPFKKQLFKILRLLSLPERLYQHLYFNGQFTVKIEKDKSFEIIHYGFIIENQLFWSGVKSGWEKVSLSLWMNLVKDSEYILDIGANTGLYSLIAKTLNPTAKVYAFEPVKRVFEKLERNIKINNFDIHTNEFAISNKTGEAIIYDNPNAEHVYSVTVNKDLSVDDATTVEVTIQTKTLNDFIQEKELPRVDLIKLDVETHEPEVLMGYSKFLAKHKPSMLIEILNDAVGKKVEDLLNGLDYLYFNIDENTGLKKVPHIVQSAYFNYLICSEEVANRLGLLK